MDNLSDEQRLHILELLERHEEIPVDYKYLLFPPERREYELVYESKEREADILAQTMGVPLQSIRAFGNVGTEWSNMLIFGDNLQAMKALLRMKEQGRLQNADGSHGIKLVYIDPPFSTRQEFRGGQEEKAYQDKIAGAAFLEFIRRRIIFIKELLSDDGLLVLHIDYRYGHYIKVLLDEIFENGFRNDIKVPRGTKNVQNQFEHISALTTGDDSLLLYAKSSTTRLKHLRIDLDEVAAGKWDTFWRGTDRPTMRYKLFNQKPDTGQWRWKESRALEAKANYDTYIQEYSDAETLDEYYLRKLDEGIDLDFVRLNDDSVVQYFVAPRDTRVASTLWTDVRTLGRVTRYPTEKHEELLDRIIDWLTEPDDIVMDAFSGSGTTIAVAEKLDRKWIGIDVSKLAIYSIQKRLLNLKADIGNKGDDIVPKAFSLYNAGLYDFERLRELSWEDWRVYALSLFQSEDKPHKVKGIELDGYREGDHVLVFKHMVKGGVMLDYGYVDNLHQELGSRIGSTFYIIAPAASVAFLEDYIDKDNTRFYILRIPYSIINELHSRDFEAIVQPSDETQVNATVEAVGFDFIRQPKVVCSYFICQPNGQMFKEAVIEIKTFKSEALAKGASHKDNLETLSMVLVDYNYAFDPERTGEDPLPPFELDAVFYANELEKSDWKVRMPLEDIGDFVMVIYLDIYGNEYTEIKALADFKSS